MSDKMQVKDLIEKLKEYPLEAKVLVVAHDYGYPFSIAFGGSDGGTKETAIEVLLCVDELCGKGETPTL